MTDEGFTLRSAGGGIKPVLHPGSRFHVLLATWLVWTLTSLAILVPRAGEAWQSLGQLLNGQVGRDTLWLLPPLGCLLLLWPLLGAWRRWHRLRAAIIAVDDTPARIGETLRGRVQLPGGFRPGLQADVHLHCIEVTSRRDVGHTVGPTRMESVRWRGQGEAHVVPGADGPAIEFGIDIPQGLPGTQPHTERRRVRWHLEIHVPQLGFRQVYDVPVLPAQDGGATHAPPVAASGRAVHVDIPPQVAQVRTAPEGFTIDFQPGRVGALANGILLAGCLMLCAGLFMGWQLIGGLAGAAPGSLLQLWIDMLLAAALTPVGAALAVGGWYLRANRLQVSLDRERLQVRRAFLWYRSERSTPRAQIVGVAARQQGQQGQGADARVNYALQAQTRAGDLLTVADGIQGEQLLHQLRELFQAQLPWLPGLPASARRQPPAWWPYLQRLLRLTGLLIVLGSFALFFLDMASM